jgi:hypothetical protein
VVSFLFSFFLFTPFLLSFFVKKKKKKEKEKEEEKRKEKEEKGEREIT